MSLTRQSPEPHLTHKHDGHVEGWLNCVALRHGWTRTFSLSPAEVSALEYSVLEKILELATLKLRHINLRIFVENPAESGIYSKVRFWKDDGSLQSVLVKEFFEGRMRDGGLLRFEIRDGRQRTGGVLEEDATVAADSVGAAADSFGSEAHSPILNTKKKRGTLDWFKKATRDPAHTTEDKSPSRARRFIAFFVSFAAPKAIPASQAPPASPVEEREEVEAPPHEDGEHERLMRRKSRIRSLAHASSPFFASSTTRLSVRVRPDRPLAVRFQPSAGEAPAESGLDATEDEGVELEDVVLLPASRRSPLSRLRRFLTKAAAPAAAPAVSRKLKRRTAHRKSKPVSRSEHAHFRGADVVRRPEDAWPHRPDSGKTMGVHAGSSVSAQRLDQLLGEDDDDPFRG